VNIYAVFSTQLTYCRASKINRLAADPLGFEDFRQAKIIGPDGGGVVAKHPDFKSLAGKCEAQFYKITKHYF